MKAIFYLLMALPVLGRTALAQEHPVIESTKDQKAVAAAVEALRKAMVDPDRETLSRLTMEQLSYGHSSGVVQDKAAFIEALTSGKSDFVSIELSQQTITVVEKTAVVRHILSAVTNDGGKPGQVKIAILLVWQRQEGDWRLLARQAVKLAQ